MIEETLDDENVNYSKSPDNSIASGRAALDPSILSCLNDVWKCKRLSYQKPKPIKSKRPDRFEVFILKTLLHIFFFIIKFPIKVTSKHVN